MDLGSLVGNLSMGGLIAGVVFSGVGFVAFMYGKKQGLPKAMALGGALMVYPFFVTNTALICLIGCALTAALFFYKD